ncbi:hypothetical protein G7Z17_g7269 [Cylindrodendrum hubeiense]|uniref:Uncharacterized protein n=1 Tax=Cylindrodendrum hubeiense TaxID=595255 RepID=A0A9P5LFG7_9HYPO|nr:hypothetical protein G7Z17_g7269 [Cylindrodendrum hubeiense]
MQFSTQLLYSITAFTFLISTINAQVSGDIICSDGDPNDIEAADLDGIIEQLQGGLPFGDITDPVTLLAFGRAAVEGGDNNFIFGLDTAQVEIANPFIFESTTVTFATISAAVQQIKDRCCGVFPTCIGATSQVQGDTGLSVNLIISRQ